MPYKEHKVKRAYFTIGQVADIIGVNSSAIRFWESTFGYPLHSKRIRRRKLERRFTQADLDKLSRIADLTRSGLYTMKGIQQIIENKLTSDD